MIETRDAVIVSLVLFVAAVCTVVGVTLSERSLAFALSPMAVFAGVAFFAFVLAAMEGRQWPLLVVFLIAILIFSTAFRLDGQAGRTGFDLVSFARLGIFLAAFALGLRGLVGSYHVFLRSPGALLLAYWAWTFISAAYSNNPTYTLAASFGLLAWIFFGASMAERFSKAEILVTILLSCSIFVYVSWILFLFVPVLGQFYTGGEGRIVRFIGLAGQPNQAGQICAVYLLSLVSLFLSERRALDGRSQFLLWWFVVGGFLAVLALVLTQSRGSMGGLAAALIVLFLQRSRSLPVALMLAMAAVPIGVAIFVSMLNPLAQFGELLVGISRGGSAEEILTLTGRTTLWSFVWDRILETPIAGHGYGASAGVIAEGYTTRWGGQTVSAHNAFLQTLLDLGFVGGFLLVAVFVSSFVSMLKRPNDFKDAMFVFVFVVCLLESGISKAASAMCLIWVISLFCKESGDGLAGAPARRITTPVRSAGEVSP